MYFFGKALKPSEPQPTAFELLAAAERLIIAQLTAAECAERITQQRIVNFCSDAAYLHLVREPADENDEPSLWASVQIESIRGKGGGSTFRATLFEPEKKRQRKLLAVVQDARKVNPNALLIVTQLAEMLGLPLPDAAEIARAEKAVADTASAAPSPAAKQRQAPIVRPRAPKQAQEPSDGRASDIPTEEEFQDLLKSVGVRNVDADNPDAPEAEEAAMPEDAETEPQAMPEAEPAEAAEETPEAAPEAKAFQRPRRVPKSGDRKLGAGLIERQEEKQAKAQAGIDDILAEVTFEKESKESAKNAPEEAEDAAEPTAEDSASEDGEASTEAAEETPEEASEPVAEEAAPTDETQAEEPEGDDPATEEAPAEEPEAAEEPQSEEPAAEEAQPAEEDPAPETEEEPSAETPAEDSPAEDPPETAPEEPTPEEPQAAEEVPAEETPPEEEKDAA